MALIVPGDGELPAAPVEPQFEMVPMLIPLAMVPTQFQAENVGVLPDGRYLIRLAFWDAGGLKVIFYPSDLAKKIADDIAMAASGLMRAGAMPPPSPNGRS